MDAEQGGAVRMRRSSPVASCPRLRHPGTEHWTGTDRHRRALVDQDRAAKTSARCVAPPQSGPPQSGPPQRQLSWSAELVSCSQQV